MFKSPGDRFKMAHQDFLIYLFLLLHDSFYDILFIEIRQFSYFMPLP